MLTSNCMCRLYIDTNNPQGMQLGRLKNKFVNRKLEKRGWSVPRAPVVLVKIYVCENANKPM